jgi:peptidoglycan/LPS O-acetylase OafA/YrhL
MKNKTFFPHLDALRFFAFFAVFVNHVLISFGYYNPNPTFKFIQKNFLSAGGLGVSFFFVLSGFLITYLLLEEKENQGRIDIKKFYIRRILRIWPLYFLIVVLSLFLFPLFKGTVPANFPIRFATDQLNPWLYVGFAGNFDYLWHGISNVLIGVLWSVSIEEQFYVFWPLIIAFVPRKRLLPVFLLIIAGSTLFRFFCTDGGSLKIITYHSFSCVSDLAVGAVLAYLAANKKFVERIEQMPGLVIEGIYFVGFALLPFREFIWKFGVHYVHAAAILPVLIAIFFAFVIMEQCYAKNSFFKAGNLKRISRLGTYSYGLYCYHMTIFFLVLLCFSSAGLRITGIGPYQLVITSILSLLLTIGTAKVSYVYFEKKFLDLKKKFDT